MLLTPVPIFVQYHRSQNKYENQFQSQDQSCHFGVGNTMLTPKNKEKITAIGNEGKWREQNKLRTLTSTDQSLGKKIQKKDKISFEKTAYSKKQCLLQSDHVESTYGCRKRASSIAHDRWWHFSNNPLQKYISIFLVKSSRGRAKNKSKQCVLE